VSDSFAPLPLAFADRVFRKDESEKIGAQQFSELAMPQRDRVSGIVQEGCRW
jgi:hypothetical protein